LPGGGMTMGNELDKRVRKVVIVGRDAAAWLSALAIQRSFGQAGVEVEMVELPSALRPQDVYLTLPTQQAFHKLLGLDENRLLRACSGLFSLGQRFSNWSGSGGHYLHAYDTHGVSLSNVDFFQYWSKARASGLKLPLEDFSLGATAAKQGRFVLHNDSTRVFSKASYGYNLGAIAYLRALGKVALQAGLRHTVGELASVQREGQRILSLTLRQGATIEGDLFIDASGPEACLMRQLEDTDNFQSWRHWLPCDRVMAASAPVLEPIPSFSQVSAFREGWLAIIPLVDRTALVAAYSARHADDKEMLQKLSVLSGLRLTGDAVTDVFKAGGRKRHWIGNCVAMGDTAVNLDPLDAAQLHLLHTGLSWLVSLFPVDREAFPEAAVYNAKMASHAAGVRDFQACHFKLNRRFGEPLWDAVREQDAPATLAHKIRLFEARGVVALQEDETFLEENWTSIFVGHHLFAKTWDPQVDRIPDHEQIANFQRMLKFIAGEVAAMPSLQAHIELNAPQTQSDYIFG